METPCKFFTDAATPMNTVFFDINFSQKMPSFAMGLIALRISEFVSFVKTAMLASCRYDKMAGIDAAFGLAPVMKDLALKQFFFKNFPNLYMSRTITLSVPIPANTTHPEPAARIGLNENKISNALRESTKVNLYHKRPHRSRNVAVGLFF